jgi:hypothetical protein
MAELLAVLLWLEQLFSQICTLYLTAQRND